jgi:hypothetical protein
VSAKAAPQAINAATTAVISILLRIGGTSVSGGETDALTIPHRRQATVRGA